MRIPKSFEEAAKEGLEFSIKKTRIANAHPNTALITAYGANRNKIVVQLSSLGGGRIMINTLDGIEVNCTGECPTLIVHNKRYARDTFARVTTLLAQSGVNIATMHLYRDKRGGYAVMVIETDQQVKKDDIDWLREQDGIMKVTCIN